MLRAFRQKLEPEVATALLQHGEVSRFRATLHKGRILVSPYVK